MMFFNIYQEQAVCASKDPLGECQEKKADLGVGL